MKTENRIGVIRDARYLEHMPGHMHPEHPNRIKSIYRMLDNDFSDRVVNITADAATLEDLEMVHTPSYIKKVMKTAEQDFTSLAPDTPASRGTYLAAWLAVGGCLKGLDRLLKGEFPYCFALVRPPGHHALPDRAGGFCIFNNIGVTALHALKSLKRILIIDWDIHHGNGINQLFYKDKRVLYFSTHDMLLYPYTGDWDETGSEDGAGYSINIPIPRDLTDADFLYLYSSILGPVYSRFRPELVLVAAGFDSIRNDPIGRSRLTPGVFGDLTGVLMDMGEGVGSPPVLFVLEGGYDSRILSSAVKEVLLALDGRADNGSDIHETDRARQLIERTEAIHSHYGVWIS